MSNFLWEAKFRRQKLDEKIKKFGELSTEEIQESTCNAVRNE